MMSPPQGSKKLVAVAVDKDKGSQASLKWAIETVCQKGQTLVLIHVKLRPPGTSLAPLPRIDDICGQNDAFDALDSQSKELLLPFRVFCSRKDIHSLEIVLEDMDVGKAIIEFVKISGIEILVLGAAEKRGLFRFKTKDTPGNILKGVPGFCSVYVISKGKISTSRAASRPGPPVNAFRSQVLNTSKSRSSGSSANSFSSATSKGSSRPSRPESSPRRYLDSTPMKSPFTHRKGPNGNPYEYSPGPESDISFVSVERPSVDSLFNFEEASRASSGFSDFDRASFESMNIHRRSTDAMSQSDVSSFASFENNSFMSQNLDDTDVEMQRLKNELKQTMEMYSSACKEAITAKQKALELQKWKKEEQQKLEETTLSEESARTLGKPEIPKSRVASEHAESESQKRVDSEMTSITEVEERNMFSTSDIKYRRYTIEEIENATDNFSQSRKIGEGGYGPVFKCCLDHTPAAVKVLRHNEAQGRSQFHKEVEVLSCIRHPNMVLLLGACPEYGCLVYEYMSSGSLEDRLLQRGRSPPLSWQHRFRIAAEITRGLLFLHHTKPEPIVHRDLKPGNILLDRNLVSKISDVGLARLVPPTVADTETQYRMTSAAGTLAYMDPEYQQTGMLGVTADVYSLGIMLLEILTARSPMGLAHNMRKAIEDGVFEQILDPDVQDWPVEDALCLAKLALQCCEIRRKDRPDLGTVVMPELERLRELSDQSYSNS